MQVIVTGSARQSTVYSHYPPNHRQYVTHLPVRFVAAFMVIPSGYWQANDSGALSLLTPQPPLNQPAKISSRWPFLQLLGL